MPVHITWGNEGKTYTVFEFEGKWTWDEYNKARAEGIDMVNSVSHMVNLIVDYSHSSFFPNNMLSNFGSSLEKVPKSFDLAVIVTESKFVLALANMIAKLPFSRGVRFKVVKTMEQAHAILAEYDKTGKAPDATYPRRPIKR